MSSSAADRDRAQQCFEAWVAASARQGGSAPDPEAHVADESDAVRSEFLAIVEDYRALTEGRPSDTGLGLSHLPASGRELGDYRLIRELGRGGMGSVWEAEQLSLGRRVALKLLHPLVGLSPRASTRFHQEAEVTARLEHPHIVRVFAAGDADGVPYIAQELVPEGRTLEREIREDDLDAALPSGAFRDLARRFAELAEGLAVAHEAGVVHRDIKPGNVLVHGEQLKLTDFGLARVLDDPSLSMSGELLGTPAYMSPEQVSGARDLGPASDQFSLGATLYEALTLQRPFPGDTREQIAQRIRQDEPVDPQKLRSRVPRDLATICMRMLRKQPSERYRGVQAAAADLRAFVDGRPIQARPLSGVARAWLWLRRRPSVAAMLGVTVVAFVAVTMLAISANRGWRQAEVEAGIAAQQRDTAQGIEEFLLGVFARMSPGREFDPETPGRALLDAAEADLAEQEGNADAGLARSPVVRAGLWMSLGSLEASLGENEKAETFLRRALAMHEEHVGIADQRTLKAHNQLAELLVRRAKYEEAEQHYLAAQRGHDELYGPTSPEALENQGNLAFLYWRQERLDEAEPLLRASLRGTEQRWGSDHFHAWSARNNLGALLIAREDGAAAEPLMREVVAARIAEHGQTAPPTLSARTLLVSAIRQQEGREAEALPLARQLLADTELTYGPQHPTTAHAQHSLGVLLATIGEPEEASQWLERAWRIRIDRLRPGHPSTQSSMRNLRKTWKLRGLDPDEQEAALRESVAAG